MMYDTDGTPLAVGDQVRILEGKGTGLIVTVESNDSGMIRVTGILNQRTYGKFPKNLKKYEPDLDMDTGL